MNIKEAIKKARILKTEIETYTKGNNKPVTNSIPERPKRDTGKNQQQRKAYKLYSNLLGDYLWIVLTDKDMQVLMDQGITEPIYTNFDILELEKLPKEALKAVHMVKRVFPGATIKSAKETTH